MLFLVKVQAPVTIELTKEFSVIFSHWHHLQDILMISNVKGGGCRDRSTSPMRGDVSTNALAGYTKGIKLDKSKEGVSGLPADKYVLSSQLLTHVQ